MPSDARPLIFAAATVILAYLFRTSLLHPRTHGFYRFFVFEAILALILVNAPRWFVDPLAWNQVISWLLLVASIVPVVLGTHALSTYGRPDVSARPEPGLQAFERTSRLVQEGIFHYMRHPMYFSLLLLAWGVFFKAPSAPGIALAVAATAGVMLMARLDEAECIKAFGPQYIDYMRRTRRFIPYVY